MNIYKALKWFGRIRSRRLKLMGLTAMHLAGRRYIGVFFDPAMGCNISCRMCYMSDPAQRSRYNGERATAAHVEAIAKTLFPRAMKLQIGCATEPLLSPLVPGIIRKARECGVPYISITTNGQLLTARNLGEMIESGLNEVTLSVHGLRRETYEYLMKGARFSRFVEVVELLKAAKRVHPDFRIRINYVVNSMNLSDLKDLFTGVICDLDFDILQIRPFQDMGDTSYADHNLNSLIEQYDSVLLPAIERCRREGRICIAPEKANILALETTDSDPSAALFEELTYFYVGIAPGELEFLSNHGELMIGEDTFGQYARRTGLLRKMLRYAFGKLPASGAADSTQNPTGRKESTRKLNYKVK